MPFRPVVVALIAALHLATGAAACSGGTAGSLPDAGPPPIPPEVVIDGPEQLAVGGQAVFRVLARRKGKPVPSEPVRVGTEAGKEVFAGVTSRDGACDVRFEVAEVALEGDDEVHLVFQVGTSPSQSRTSRSLSVRSAWRPILELDHRWVSPGGTVRARLIVFHPDRLAGVEGVATSLEFVTPSGIPVRRSEGATDASGLFSASLTLEDETPWGKWTVRAKAGERITDQFTVLPPASGEAPTKPAPTPNRILPPDTFDLRIRAASGLLAGGLDNPLVALVTLAGVPAAGAEVVVRHGDAKASGRTGDKGETWMSLAIPDGGSPVKLKARVSDDKGRRLEREFVLPRHPGGGGLVVRPAFAVAPPGKPIRVQVDGPAEGQVVVDAWRRGRLVATMSSALVSGQATVDAHPEILGPGLVWFVARSTGRGATHSWGAAPTFVPPLGALTIRPTLGDKSYASGDKGKLTITVEDDMAKPTAAALFGIVREAEHTDDFDGVGAARSISRRLAARLLDGLQDSTHPAGDLYDLVAEGLTTVVPASSQAVARMHLAGLTFENSPGPWPVLSRAVSGEAAPSTAPAKPVRFTESNEPVADAVIAFPSALRTEVGAPAELELPTRDQSGGLSGALVAMGQGRLGIQPFAMPVSRAFVLTVEAPGHVTSGDPISVPATVHNKIDRMLPVDLRLEMADWFELSDVQQTRVKPGPGGSETAAFRITPRAVGTHELKFVAKTEESRKEVVVKVTVHPDGQPFEIARAGLLSQDSTVVKLTLPPVTKDVPERAYLAIDPTSDSILHRALNATLAIPRADLVTAAAAVRIIARIAARAPPKREHEDEDLTPRTQAMLAPMFQGLLRFRRTDGAWAMWRGGPANDEAGTIAGATLPLLAAAGIVGAKEAMQGLPEPLRYGEGEASTRHPTATSLLKSREGDGSWGSLLDTEQAVIALLKVDALQTPPVDVVIEMDGNPLLNKLFDPGGPPMRVDLPERIAPGPHFVRIVVPTPDLGLPWTLIARTTVRWPNKPPPVLGWKVKLRGSRKIKRKGKGTLKLVLSRTEDAEPGPLVVRLAMPPGGLPIRADLDAAVSAGTLGGYGLSPGFVDLFLNTESDEGPLETVRASFRFVATIAGRFHTPPAALWSLRGPGIVGHIRGPKISVK